MKLLNRKGFVITGGLIAGAGMFLAYLLLGASGALQILKYGKYIVIMLGIIIGMKMLMFMFR